MHPGDSWLYVQKFIRQFGAYQDTVDSSITGYAYYSVSKDTTVDGHNAVIIEGTRYSIGIDSIYTDKQRWAVSLGDTILMYTFKNDNGMYIPGILKCRAGHSIKETLIHSSTKDTASVEFDTSVFNVLTYPVIFPLEENAIFIYRPASAAEQSISASRKFRGIETITVPAGSFTAYRFEFLVDGFLQGDDEWIGEHGLIKKSVTGETTELDSDGSIIVSGTFEERTELSGRKNIDPDTLVPWGLR